MRFAAVGFSMSSMSSVRMFAHVNVSIDAGVSNLRTKGKSGGRAHDTRSLWNEMILCTHCIAPSRLWESATHVRGSSKSNCRASSTIGSA